MAGHAQLKFVMTECSKTQIRLTGLSHDDDDVIVCFVLNIKYIWAASSEFVSIILYCLL